MSISPDRQRWDERFSEQDYLFGTAPNACLAAQKKLLPLSGTALALADGEGRNGVWLAQQGLSVTSVDFSPVALEKARRLAAARRVALATVQADLAEWTWPAAQVDVVAAIFIQFAGPTLRDAIFRGIRRALKPGGILVLQGYRPEQLRYGTGGPPCAENMYTAQMLREVFAGFDILHLEEHDSEVNEGGGHRGMSALVDLVARRPQEEQAVFPGASGSPARG